MIEVFCPNCQVFVEMKKTNLVPPEAEGDYAKIKGVCPKCKEIAEVKIQLHWQGL